MATEQTGTMAPFCMHTRWDKEGADGGISGGLKAKHMEPEGALGAHSAPQATRGPALTLIVEEEPLAV